MLRSTVGWLVAFRHLDRFGDERCYFFRGVRERQPSLRVTSWLSQTMVFCSVEMDQMSMSSLQKKKKKTTCWKGVFLKSKNCHWQSMCSGEIACPSRFFSDRRFLFLKPLLVGVRFLGCVAHKCLMVRTILKPLSAQMFFASQTSSNACRAICHRRSALGPDSSLHQGGRFPPVGESTGIHPSVKSSLPSLVTLL